MRTLFKKFTPVRLTVAILAFCLFPFIAGAAGILSEPINVDNARRGQSHWEELLFMNPSGSALTFNLSAEGAIAKWVSFYNINDTQTPITQLVVPASSNLGAKIKFTIPDTAKNGKYQGLIVGTTLSSSANTSAQTSAQITQRLDREVNITVTDNQIVDFNTIFTPVTYTMAKDEPFKVKMIHENSGNVDIKPNVELSVSRNNEEMFKAVFPYPDNTAAIQPNERKEIPSQVEWRTVGYEPGKYNVVLSTYENNQLNQKEQFMISIGGANTNSSGLSAKLISFIGDEGMAWATIASIVAIIASALILARSKFVYFKK